MFLPLFSLCWMMLFCSLPPSLYRLPKQQERRRKKHTFFSYRSNPFYCWNNPFKPFATEQTDVSQRCNGWTFHPVPLFHHPETPVPLYTPHLQTPTLFRNFFFENFLLKFLPNFFWKKFFSLYKKRGIYHQSKKIFLMIFSHYAFSSTRL